VASGEDVRVLEPEPSPPEKPFNDDELNKRRREVAAEAAPHETYHRAGTVEALGDLEVVPRRKVTYKGLVLEEMDLDEIILRHPDLIMVDELARTNSHGSKHAKRWQDTQELLDDGISVISTLNIQHLESLADIVSAITGVEVHERIPDSVVDQADEIELVDLSPRALRQRIERGDVYPGERASNGRNYRPAYGAAPPSAGAGGWPIETTRTC
jgi:K+-sensing histidine kinase KdpD